MAALFEDIFLPSNVCYRARVLARDLAYYGAIISFKKAIMLMMLPSQRQKQHEVWETSFDWKDCRSNEFAWQKLNYMHNNPCIGKWQLAANPIENIHSSAKFYLTGVQGIYPVSNFMEMEKVNFNLSKE